MTFNKNVMKEIYRKDISELKEFEKYGDVIRQIRHYPETGWWLYDRGSHYEVVRGKKHTNPDGSVVYVYPSSEDWGTYGYSVWKNKWADKMIEFIVSAPTHTAQEMYEFKKTL